MDELQALYNKIDFLIKNWNTLVNKFILEFEPQFIDIVHSQLRSGKDGDGNSLDTYVDPEYTKFKKAIGSSSAPIADLFVTGDFYQGMKMDESFDIFSTDYKNDSLHRKYGEAITEVQEGNMNALIQQQILPEFIEFILSKI